MAWLISNPENVQIISRVGTPAGGDSATREFALTYLNGLLSTVTRAPNGSSDQRVKTTYGRDDFGNINQVTEEARSEPTRSTGITYDSDGVFPNTITNADGHVTQVRYDARWGQPFVIVDPNGVAGVIIHDDFGRVAVTSGPDGTAISSYASIATPNTITAVGVVQPRFQVTTESQGTQGTHTGGSVTEYDAYGRAVRTTSDGFGGVGVITEQAYDALGRLIGVTRAHTADLTTVPFDRYSYDDLQRVTRVDHSDGTSKQYQYASSASFDPASPNSHWLNGMSCEFGLPISFCAVGFVLTIDEEGHANAAVTDYRGRTFRSIDGDNVAIFKKSSNYVYGPFDQVIEADDNLGLATKFNFDDYGRLLKHTDLDTGTSVNTYNGFDELKTSTDQKKQTRTYGYDSLGRMTSVIDPAGTTQWIYDQGINGLGRISESISPSTPENPAGQQIRYSYEPPTATGNRAALQSVTYTIDGSDYPVSLDYDDLGRTSRIHYPNPGNGQPIIAQYQYDPSGVLSGLNEVGSGVTATLWHLDEVYQGHLIQHETFGNSATTTYTYNADRRFLEKIQTTLGAKQIQSLNFTHYNNGLVHVLTNADRTPLEYQYDNLNRLSSVNTLSDVPMGTLYSYDDIGNLVGRGPATTTYQSAQPHLVKTVGDNSYQYDGNGNVSARQGPDIPGGNQIFTYTPFDLPRSITTGGISPFDPNTKTIGFEYTADEERVVRRDPRSVRHFVSDLYQRNLDPVGNVLEERFRLFVGDRQLGEIVRVDGIDKTLYFHSDHLGSTTTLSDSNGIVTQQEFDPFGAPIDPPNPEITRVGFTGQDQDIDLGLTDMNGRIYDPLAGRFTTADPVVQAPFWSQGLNRYSYVFNNPINFTDPSGFDAAETASDPSIGITAWGGATVGIAALQGASLGSIAGGTGLVGGNVATSLLTGQYSLGDGSSGFTRSATAPSAAPAANGVNKPAPGAGTANKGGVRELATPIPTPDFNVQRGPDRRFAGDGACDEDGPCDPYHRPHFSENGRVNVLPMELLGQAVRGALDLPGRLWRWLRSPAPRGRAEILSDTFGKTRPGLPKQKAESVLGDIRAGRYKPPSDLTRQDLEYYRKVAQDAIDGPKGDPQGVQAVRIQIVDELLKVVK